MNTKKINQYLGWLLVIFLAVGLVASPVQAQDNPQDEQRGQLIIIEPPDLENIDIPTHLDVARARTLALQAMASQRRQVFHALRSLQDQGLVGEAQLTGDGMAIRVWDVRAPKRIEALPGVRELRAATEGDSCAAQTLQILQGQLLARSGVQAMKESEPQSAAVDLQIRLYTSNAWIGYSEVYGNTQADTAVTMKILRGGLEVFSATQTSSEYGGYAFWPNWIGIACGGRYAWELRPGDVVEVSAGGTTERTTFINILAWMEPLGNLMQGRTAANRSIYAKLYFLSGGNYQEEGATATSDGTGYFSLTASSIRGQTQAEIRVSDANGNLTEKHIYANHVVAETNGKWFGGYWEPTFGYTGYANGVKVELQRGGGAIETRYVPLDEGGYYSGAFTESLKPGDVVAVSSPAYAQSLVMADLSISFDPPANQFHILTDPDRYVLLYVDKNSSTYPLRTACEEHGSFWSGSSGPSGEINSNPPYQIERGDNGYLEILDAAENYQYAQRYVGFVAADPVWDEVFGAWESPAASLTINLRDSGANLKETRNVTASTWDGYYYTDFSVDLVAGDAIAVTDGIATLNVQVDSLTVKYDANTEHITGYTSTSGQLLATIWDWLPDKGYSTQYCYEMVAPGTYDIDASSASTGAWDEAEMVFWGNGYTIGYGTTFSVDIYQASAGYSDEVSGYTEVPGEPVTVKLWNGTPGAGSSVLETENTTSSQRGEFWVEFSTAFAVNHVIEVLAGKSAQLKIPTLTVNHDAPNNAIYGSAPANGIVHVTYGKYFACRKGDYACGAGIDRVLTANASGNYNASFKKWFLWLWGDHAHCDAVQVGSACSWSWIEYYYPQGHSINANGPDTGGDASDAYESDNTAGEARAYAGPSIHNFHSSDDVDWISLTIDSGGVGQPLFIDTSNLGSIADPVLEVFASDGMTVLASNDDAGNSFAASLVWTPPAQGTYYIKVIPYSQYNAEDCSSAYTLSITPYRLFLPLAARQE